MTPLGTDRARHDLVGGNVWWVDWGSRRCCGPGIGLIEQGDGQCFVIILGESLSRSRKIEPMPLFSLGDFALLNADLGDDGDEAIARRSAGDLVGQLSAIQPATHRFTHLTRCRSIHSTECASSSKRAFIIRGDRDVDTLLPLFA